MQALDILLVQAKLRWRDPQANRDHLASLVDDHAGKADLVVFPETFTTGFLGDQGARAEGMDGDTVRWMRELAADTGAAVCGSLAIDDGGQRRNRFLFVTPGGEAHHYDKRHLFAHGGEDQRYAAGDRRVVIDWRGWRICLQVCYDLRFPAWCRNRDDYDLLLFTANWPERRIDAWDTLLRARAIENQCYTAAVNRVGEDGKGIRYPGHSAVYGPLGETVAFLDDGERCQSATIDPDHLNHIRSALPFLPDRDEFEMKIKG